MKLSPVIARFLLGIGVLLGASTCQAQGKLPAVPAALPSSPGSPAPLYQETSRPQFHFTAKQGWLNDPNGLVYFDGEYHLFFQCETDLSGGDPRKSWGHAVSTDLVHWRQLANVLVPDKFGPIWSGSAVVDSDNTSGLGSAGKPPLVAFYTSAGGQSLESAGREFAQSLAFSNDRGRTWTKYAQNPVLPPVVRGNRDPKVVWYAPTRRWIMALYLEWDRFGLFSSPDLKEWTKVQTLTLSGSGGECPDFFPLPLAGTSQIKWVFSAADGRYLVGRFDGTTFTPETSTLPGDGGANIYAAQTFNGIPARSGRRIQIAWMRDGYYPNMPFNQQMSFPCTLTLHTTPDGPRLFRWPVTEITKLYSGTTRLHGKTLQPRIGYIVPADGCDLIDMEAEFSITPGAAAFGLRVRGTDIRYDVAAHTLICMGRQVPLLPESNKVTLRLLLDRTSLEVYGNAGAASMTSCFTPSDNSPGISVYTEGGPVTLVSLTVHPLRSAWAAP